jgi:aspartate kinase
MGAAGVNVDMIVQNISSQGVTDISFTVPASAAAKAVEVAEQAAADIGADGVDLDPDISKITVVGAGMKSESGVAAKMFRILSDADVNIEMISTSTIRISCVVRGDDTEAAVEALHRELIEEAS